MLDDLDAQILRYMQEDARISMADLAEKVHSSRSVVWRRIQRLEDDGVIKKQTVLVDGAKVGLDVMVFAHVKMQTQNRDSLPGFITKVQNFPEVMECHTLMGDIDFLLKVLVGNVKAYEDFFWNRLSQIEGIREINSSIALTAVKSTTEITLPSLRAGK